MLLSNTLYYQRQEDNASGIAKIIALLELLTALEKKGRHINQGKVKIDFDNKKGYDKILKKIYKVNTCA